MAEKFNPAPRDKHAVDTREAARLDGKAATALDEGLMDTFPASDPVSAQQPSTTRVNAASGERDASGQRASSLWEKVRSAFAR
ncbi:hypothetical protein SSBR45G_51610 [Bradyrhizobium sp. SSBR45G]|uniref:hypothetical protein n=1 Tax=unclassified Bradyrhizobium TaxID=2631580 RepID=UPI002342A40B|nr:MULTISPECIES: hypothetical protein [unclassified Bradyrhizobium]GLH80252.1 hypothetical protein SSBR45G_51610 [Bradyrhizobium sp. SSBR45G]GLH87746.1 hypothetical protein SSBR45R_52060 [Bradyrhizobium sp. SSBR45R]